MDPLKFEASRRSSELTTCQHDVSRVVAGSGSAPYENNMQKMQFGGKTVSSEIFKKIEIILLSEIP